MTPAGNYIQVQVTDEKQSLVTVPTSFTHALVVSVSPDISVPFGWSATVIFPKGNIVNLAGRSFVNIDHISLYKK